MLGTVLIAAIAASSIGFNLRFLLALCRECKPRWICYLLRLQPETNPHNLLDEDEVESSVVRAA
jgi:hypothetical protein